jgi:hypothetical protein
MSNPWMSVINHGALAAMVEIVSIKYQQTAILCKNHD